MHALVFFMLATGSCLAYYGDMFGYRYGSRNYILREEPQQTVTIPEDLVECPVCYTDEWVLKEESCSIELNGKIYKKCLNGTYFNMDCGGHLDCYRGKGEQCTVKLVTPTIHLHCAHGTVCHGVHHRCLNETDSVSVVDIALQDSNNIFRLTKKRSKPINPFQLFVFKPTPY